MRSSAARTLEIKESVTPDDFIRLVLKWNETSSHIENRVSGIDWRGEHNVRYGTENLWLEFVELPEKSIMAVRHEKKQMMVSYGILIS